MHCLSTDTASVKNICIMEKQKSKLERARAHQKQSKEKKQNQTEKIELGKIGIALLIWSVVGFIMAMYFNGVDVKDTYQIIPLEASKRSVKTGTSEAKPVNIDERPAHQISPIIVETPGEVYEVTISSRVDENTWSFYEVEVLDEKDNYLFSFGEELWHETGRDSDGSWREKYERFDTKMTFPEPGIYKLNFLVTSKRKNSVKRATVVFTKRNGSSIAHFWFAVLLAIAGLILIEIQYGTFREIAKALDND